jgi:hypothetical protein
VSSGDCDEASDEHYARSAMRIPPYLLACLGIGLVACTSGTSDAAPVTSAPTTIATTTTTPPTTELEVVTTIRRVPSAELASVGHVTVGSIQYDFAFECWAAGAGDILALGVGEDPDSDQPTQAIVQAFFGQAYVSVLIGDDRVLELAIDAPADLFVQSDTIRGSALRFVDAEGAAGEGESLGLGTVTVECNGFAPGLPEGYDIS